MANLRPILYAAIAFVVMFGLIGVSARVLLPHLWRSRIVRWAYFVAAVVTAVALSLWAAGWLSHRQTFTNQGTHLGWIMLAIVLPLALAVPVAGGLWKTLERALLKGRIEPAKDAPTKPTLTRRELIQWGTATIPMSAIAVSGTGLLAAAGSHDTPRIAMPYADLHPDLDGLRILQLTDLHLGHFHDVADLERVLRGFSDEKPDLIVFTGDIADDLRQLVPALKLADALKPRLGVFGAVGNHEMFRGLAEVQRLFDKSPVPLLLERGTTLAVGGARLHVAGLADPGRLGGDVSAFLRQSLDVAMDGAPSDAFHLVLSHRPDGFVPASAQRIALTLAGHTHGGQVGLFGRSAFEPLFPEKFLRGAYDRGSSRLYTSAGFGHWFPFRLNCPTEAPTIVLSRA